MKRTSTIIALAALAGCLAVGCSKSTYFQVYQTQPVNPEKCVAKDGNLVHESGDFTVRYNFFAENGDAGFWFINNSDSVVFLNLAESFFIRNGKANDDYTASHTTQTLSSTTSKSSKSKSKSDEFSEGSSHTLSNATTVDQLRIIAIPPHSTKYISEYSIAYKRLKMCGVKDTPKKGKPLGLSFTVENSPLFFGNYITYTVGCKGKKQHIDDRFFASEIINVNGAAMYETVRLKDACGKETGEKDERIRYATPDRFYIKYKIKKKDLSDKE